MAACEATKEMNWPHKFILNLEVVLATKKLITLYCDNRGAIANSKEPRSHKREKKHKAKISLIEREFKEKLRQHVR